MNRCLLVVVLATAACGLAADAHAGDPNYLYPDLFPFVDEDRQYLQNWQIDDDEIRIQTAFANQGDGLFQIRQDNPGPVGQPTPLTQRIFIDVDDGPNYTDFYVNDAIYKGDNRIHFEDYTEFSLLEVTTENGILGVGDVVSSHMKSSHNLVHSFRLPGEEWENAPSYGSQASIFQNVSAGWADVYSHGSTHQFIPIGGVPVGPLYWLRQAIDPTNVIQETDETNNDAQILIDLSQPGETFFNPDGTFKQPGDLAQQPESGDLNMDGDVNTSDWVFFKQNFGSDLSGLSPEEAYYLSDLNGDGQHSIEDIVVFRETYEAINGANSFAAASSVPEPGSATIIAILSFGAVASLGVQRSFRLLRR
ncbi:MAG: lysyl oxidase family protein [Aeoliella sp.]